jgi:hypothetical protein
MTLAVEQGKARKDLVYRLRIEIGRRLDNLAWTQADAPNTNAWYIAHPEGEPSRVRQYVKSTDAISTHTSRATLALCHANASSWYYDSATSRLYVNTSGSDNPGGGLYLIESHFWDRFCTAQDGGTDAVYYSNAWHLPLLGPDSIPDVTLEATPFSEGGVRQSFGTIKLINGGYFDQRLYDYIYSAAPAILEVGAAGDIDGAFVVLWRGWTGNVEWSEEYITLAIEDERRIAV